MTSTKAPALERTVPPSEFDIGTPVEWMVDPDRRETILGVTYEFIPIGAKADSGGESQRAKSLNLWRQVLGGRGHGCSDRIAGGF